MDYWPDDPPWTSLFGEIGTSFCENWQTLKIEEKSNLFEIIELSMQDFDDEYLQNVITTGFIESLIHCTDKNQNLWLEIESYMLPLAKEFALAYKNAIF